MQGYESADSPVLQLHLHLHLRPRPRHLPKREREWERFALRLLSKVSN